MARTKGATADKLWGDAIRLVANAEVKHDGEKIKRLRKVAHKLFDLAEDGDMAAVKEIGDRMDGRARQSADINHTGDIPAAISLLAVSPDGE